MIDLYGAAEDPLPLVTLSGIRAGDALRIDWPETDCIIGNPPFLGSQHIRAAFGAEYIGWLKRAFGVGVKDFCVYWFRKAHAHLQPGQRAGLVGTNSISQKLGRSASLQYIADNGGTITDAVSTQKWPGDAKVHVSLVNWIKGGSAGPFLIDGVGVSGIDASLHVAGQWTPQVLPANQGRCFQGPIPVGAGFILTDDEAKALLSRDDADYSRVVRPYLTSEDLAQDPRDDFSMGVLQSRAHVAWAWARSSTLKGDLRYTPTSAFMTFPWPDLASERQREAVADACRLLLGRRSEICRAENIGLTKLYNAMDEGAFADRKALHRELDEAVVAGYGWPRSIAQDDGELVARLTELNRQIATGQRDYHPFAYLDTDR